MKCHYGGVFMSKEDVQQKLEKVKDVLLRNKQLTDEDLEDVFAGFNSKDSAYLNGMRRRSFFHLPWM